MHTTAELQTRLAELGHYASDIDGIFGPQTLRGVRNIQRLNGLPATGKVDGPTDLALWPEATTKRASAYPTATPSSLANGWPRQADCPKFYGAFGANQAMLTVPFEMRLAWDTRVKLPRFSIHAKVKHSALRALCKIAETYSAAERAALGIDLFGGCLNVRPMRGGMAPSMHSWGIAIDFDPARNVLHSTKAPGPMHARLADPDALPFWRAWEVEGWVSLGRARDFDWMHVQAARL